MRGSKNLGWAVAVVLIGGCAPQPPYEPVTELPDYATGVTVEPVAGPPAPVVGPVTGPEETVRQVGVDNGGDPVVSDPYGQVVESGGLVERLPNTCKLENYQHLVGQNASVLPGAGLDRAWRVVGPDAIVTQEYNPARLNFRTNATGVVAQIICG